MQSYSVQICKYSTSLILSQSRLSLSFSNPSLPRGRSDSTHLNLLFSVFRLVLRSLSSAVCVCSVALWVGAAVLGLVVLGIAPDFDSVEGVVDGGAVSPAPGS